MRAMILAAGRGERLRPLTDTTPKALIEVAGKPLIVHAIEHLRTAGIADLVVNLGWLGGQLRERLGDGSNFGLSIHYSDEGGTTLETGGGIVKALPLLGDAPFWVVNSDVLCNYPFSDPQLAPDDLAHFVLTDNPEHKNGGDFALIGSRVAETGSQLLTYTGIGLYRPEFFANESVRRRPLLPMMRRAALTGHVAGEHYRGHWLDVGTVERLAAANGSAFF
ncbi:MAG: N-acetylmuramate alpha-1-phosphate uridylyltransferase MurU [Gammaproteobacteria bacterium]